MRTKREKKALAELQKATEALAAAQAEFDEACAESLAETAALSSDGVMVNGVFYKSIEDYQKTKQPKAEKKAKAEEAE